MISFCPTRQDDVNHSRNTDSETQKPRRPVKSDGGFANVPCKVAAGPRFPMCYTNKRVNGKWEYVAAGPRFPMCYTVIALRGQPFELRLALVSQIGRAHV